jgi:hypothetical protein
MTAMDIYEDLKQQQEPLNKEFGLFLLEHFGSLTDPRAIQLAGIFVELRRLDQEIINVANQDSAVYDRWLADNFGVQPQDLYNASEGASPKFQD